jgi:hypothetical protein
MKKIFIFAVVLGMLFMYVPVGASENGDERDMTNVFCDSNFLAAVVNAARGWSYGEALTQMHLDSVTYLILNAHDIRCLIGVEFLPNLERLLIKDSNLTALDISQNANLMYLRVHHNFFPAEYPHNIRGLRLDDASFDFHLGVNPRAGEVLPHACMGSRFFDESMIVDITPLPAITVMESFEEIFDDVQIEHRFIFDDMDYDDEGTLQWWKGDEASAGAGISMERPADLEFVEIVPIAADIEHSVYVTQSGVPIVFPIMIAALASSLTLNVVLLVILARKKK